MIATDARERSLPRCVLLFAICAAVGLSIAASAAQASQPDTVALAEQTAENYWDAVPCHGQVSVQWQRITPEPAIVGSEVEAWVTFDTPQGTLDFDAPASSYSNCVVNISLAVWPSYASTVEAYPQFCQMMIHEYGHFAGYADSIAYPATDIRYPLLTDANLPSDCRYDVVTGHRYTAPAVAGPKKRRGRARAGSLSSRARCFEVHCGWRLARRRLAK